MGCRNTPLYTNVPIDHLHIKSSEALDSLGLGTPVVFHTKLKQYHTAVPRAR